MRLPRILLLAQTPPPYHGQAIMQSALVGAGWTWCTVVHIRLRYSRAAAEVGRFSLRKLVHLAEVVLRVWAARLAGPIDLLYYPPAGPHVIPVLRDILTLACIRWTAVRTLLHLHAGGFDIIPHRVCARRLCASRLVYGRADAAVVLHEGLRDEVAWIRPHAVFVVPNGVADERRASSADGSGVVVYLGLLTERKGVLDLLRACALLRAAGTPCILHLGGAAETPAEAGKIREVVAAGGLADRIVLHGEVTGAAKAALFASADVFCYPSRDTEAMPVALLEALAAGVPILTVQSRTLPAIIGSAGLAVPPGDPPALARALTDLLGDARLRSSLGRAGRAHYEEHYTLPMHLQSLEAVFRKVLAS